MVLFKRRKLTVFTATISDVQILINSITKEMSVGNFEMACRQIIYSFNRALTDLSCQIQQLSIVHDDAPRTKVT